MSKNVHTNDRTTNEKIADLQGKIDWFQSDGFDLDQATKRYKDAVEQARAIEQDLINLENEITVIDKDFSQ